MFCFTQNTKSRARLMKFQNMELIQNVAENTVQHCSDGISLSFFLSVSLSPSGPFKGSYDLEWGVCDLERLDRPTEAGWDGIPGV